jgi:UDP-glucose 4-epimerase
MMEGVCESYGATYGLRSVIARLFSVYGIGLKKQLLWDLCCKLLADDGRVELGGTGEELRDWVGVNDVAGILGQLDQFAGVNAPKINVGTGIGTSVCDIAHQVLSAWDSNTPIDARLSFNGRSRPGDPFSLVAATQVLAHHGFTCESRIADGIQQYVAWFRREHASIEKSRGA